MGTELYLQIADRSVAVTDTDRAPGTTTWQALSASAAELGPEVLAAALADALPLERRGAPVTLVLPSAWCYVHPLVAAQRRPTRALLAFALEEYLPLELERLTCDFVRTAHGKYLGIAVETQRLQSLLAALQARGVVVAHITLDVFVAVLPERPAGALLWCDDEHVAQLTWRQTQLEQLQVMRLAPGLSDTDWCARIAERFSAAAAPDLTVTGCVSAERLAALRARLGTPPETDTANVGPWRYAVDLARDALAPAARHTGRLRVWRNTAAVLLVALLALCADLGLHRARVNAARQLVSAWERSLFAQLLPNEPVPAGVALRLASERRRLEGLTQVAGPAATVPPEALDTLRTVVATLPPDLRVDLQELRIDGADVTLRGTLADHRQAEQIAARLAKAGLTCDAPRTQRVASGGVQFFLHALHRNMPAETSSPAPAGGTPTTAPRPSPGRVAQTKERS